jgi:predicted TIM-barrel fold metal-dependent hydrolase
MNETMPWWRGEPFFEDLSSVLNEVPAIDFHTHLTAPGSFDPRLDAGIQLRGRSTEATYAFALTERFGVGVGNGGLEAAAKQAEKVRDDMIDRLGLHGYWADHLDFTKTEIALVNRSKAEGLDGRRLRWVPTGGTLIYPLRADQLMARSPMHRKDITFVQGRLQELLETRGMTEVPGSLNEYLVFVEDVLAEWMSDGAVGIKFLEAYVRTLLFEDVAADDAQELFRRGLDAPLSRDEYLALQDHLIRHIIQQAGAMGLPIQLHTGFGIPPFLRASDSDVHNLEPVLTDPRFFDTQFVLIHGGHPQHEDAAYLALKPHVWVDISALPFVYEIPKLADVYRIYLRSAPEKVLFGTDAQPFPGVPVSPDVQHIALSRHAREALNLALAWMTRDRLVDLEWAIRIGKGVLNGNAKTLLGLS